MKRGEIYLAGFPFGDVATMKLRPVLLLAGPVGPVPEVVVAYISSVIPSILMPSDIAIDPASRAGGATHLKMRSVLRLHKLATIHVTSLRRYLGRISDTTQKEVAARLRKLLGL